MNKTAILIYIIDEVALKCRNVSSNMRKRIHWMLKYMEITVRKYDVRALVLNGWIRMGTNSDYSEIEEMKKGISNFILETQEDFETITKLKNEVRCDILDFAPTAPIEVESIENFTIDKDNYNGYSKCSFNRVQRLSLSNLSTDQIKFILTRCKRIDRLEICDCSLQKLDFSQLE